jgi:hypothetical protein
LDNLILSTVAVFPPDLWDTYRSKSCSPAFGDEVFDDEQMVDERDRAKGEVEA